MIFVPPFEENNFTYCVFNEIITGKNKRREEPLPLVILRKNYSPNFYGDAAFEKPQGKFDWRDEESLHYGTLEFFLKQYGV